MTISLINPRELPVVPFFQQVSIATGSKLVFMAGQVAWTADGTLVGRGDLAAQVEQCFLNVGAALAAAGASFDNVVKLTTFVTDWNTDQMKLVSEGRTRACEKLGVTVQAPGTLIGVAALYAPDLLVEVEAIAIID
jgi:enamine deaminase RidA (YjgF/YER057c/UK114 family)